MRRREFISGIGVLAAWPRAAGAQTAPRPVVGLLMLARADWFINAVRVGLEEGGYSEDRNFTFLMRSADGQFERLPALAAELVNSQVAVIFATGSPVPARTAKAATATIPIVFAYGGDPVADGLVESLNRPGGNVTGATFIGSSLIAKRMELLRQIVPQAKDVALLVNPNGTLAERQIGDATAAAAGLGQRLHVLKTSTLGELETAFAAMRELKVDAFLASTDPFFGFVASERVVSLAQQYRIPAMYNGRVESGIGGLASYGPNLADTWRQAGAYVARILKGARPQDLPVVQPTKFELVINLKTAKELGLTIQPALLSLADDVIE